MRKEVIGRATLYLGDCRDVLPTLGKVDAVVTDPPYGVNFHYASHDDTPIGYPEWCAEWFAELLGICDGPIAISCGMANLSDWPKPTWVLAWHKPAAMGRCAVGFNNWEPILLYGKPMGEQGADVIRAPILPDDSLAGHPCPKPLGWAVGTINRVASKCDTILDPFMGSGTTGVAAVQMGRDFIGCEIDPAYFDIACRRIEEAQRQGDLFISGGAA
jgi:site-specific DNA-methyltransferase (adenine-specific)